MMSTKGMSLEEKVDWWLDPDNGAVVKQGYCLIWQGRKRYGYPEISHQVDGVRTWYRLHRLVCRLKKGMSDDQVAMHNCGERACINPDHLDGGTQSENIRERHRYHKVKDALDCLETEAEYLRALATQREHERRFLLERFGRNVSG